MRIKSRTDFDCESTNYVVPKEELEKIAKDMLDKPFVVYSRGNFEGERKVIGKVIEAHVIDGHIEYVADIPKDEDNIFCKALDD